MMSTPASSSMAKTSRLPSSTSKVPAPSTSSLGIPSSLRRQARFTQAFYAGPSAIPLRRTAEIPLGASEQRRSLPGRPLDHRDQLLLLAAYAPGRGREAYRPLHLAALAPDRRRHAAQVLRKLLKIRGHPH